MNESDIIFKIKQSDGLGFTELVRECEGDPAQFYNNLLGKARYLAEKRLRQTQLPEDHVGVDGKLVTYNENNLEYQMWSLIILSMSYTHEIFRKKARDGHCYKHESPEIICDEGKKLHRSLRKEFIKSIKELIIQLENIPEDAPGLKESISIIPQKNGSTFKRYYE